MSHISVAYKIHFQSREIQEWSHEKRAVHAEKRLTDAWCGETRRLCSAWRRVRECRRRLSAPNPEGRSQSGRYKAVVEIKA